MCKKLIYSTSFILVLGIINRVHAEHFSLVPIFDGHVSNDASEGPDTSPGGTGIHIRDIGGRRRVGFVTYDISEIKSKGDIFSNVSFSNYGHDVGEVNVYGVLEEYEDLVDEGITWNTAPGVQNDPTPDVDSAVALDLADVTDVLLTFNAPSRGTRESTETNEALADFLSSDTNGFVAFMLAPPEGGNAIVRTIEMGEDGGMWLEGDIGGFLETARNPEPADGAFITDTWITLGWKPGDFAVSHDVYVSENFDEVNEGAEGTFVGNQAYTFIVLGFPGFPFPDGLVPGTTYYWRVDEVNEAEPNSPWKGTVWSFTVPPKTAYLPEPADGADAVDVGVQLSWTMGYGAKMHTVYFGDNFDDVNNATVGQAQGITTYNPGTLKMAKTYYWRVDEFDTVDTFKGDVWSFIVEGSVSSPEPASGADGITQRPILTWLPGVFGASHEIFFGTDPSALEKKASGNLGSEIYEPGQLEWNTTYYWRIDEANSANVDSPWTGPVWSFTTANFLIIDDMESYNDLNPDDPNSNRIFNAWIDGFEDPTNGSLVGNENPPFAEQNIVHSGNQSMPMSYDNSAAGKSEATLTLNSNRDWTVKGVNTVTIWYRGSVDNAAEQMYVVLNSSIRVDHDDPDAATITRWTEWNIDLQSFADQGVSLTDVTSITLGLSSVTGGSGMMYFDDIRLYRPAP